MKFSLKKSILFLCALAITCLTVGLLGVQTKVYADGEETPHIITEETASIRLDKYKGIRFSSKVSVDYLKTIEGEFEVGTLIAPASYVAEGKQLDASVADAVVINHTARFNDLENMSGGNRKRGFNRDTRRVRSNRLACPRVYKDGRKYLRIFRSYR